MATVNPVFDSQIAGGATVTWSGMVTGDTIMSHEPNRTRSVAGSVTFTGTFGGATVTLQGSNDGTNWFNVGVVTGSMVNVTATAAALFDFSTAARYLRPALTGGSGNSITATMMLRG